MLEDALVSFQTVRLMHEYCDGNADMVDKAEGNMAAASLQLRCLTGGAENVPLAPILLHFSERAAEASDLSPFVSKFPHHGSDGAAADSTRIQHISSAMGATRTWVTADLISSKKKKKRVTVIKELGKETTEL